MLRVIAGKFKSRKIKEVKSKLTRPTTDKNKEVLFNLLGQFFSGGAVLDLFAGSGSLGIEAISRGMESVDFVDKSYQAIKVIKTNINTLNLDKQANTYKTDAIKFLETCTNSYDLILVDPPYKINLYQEILNLVTSRQILKINGIIVLESDKFTNIEPVKNLTVLQTKILGISKFTILRRE